MKPGTEYTIYKRKARVSHNMMSRCKSCVSQRQLERYKTDPSTNRQAKESGARYIRSRQSQSLEHAHNRYKEWTGPELEVLLRPDLTATEVALTLNRTLSAVYTMRQACKRDPRKKALAGVGRGEL